MSDHDSVIAGPNFVDATYYDVILGGGYWQSTSSINLLKDPAIGLPAVTASAGNLATLIDVDLGVDRDIRFLGIPDATVSRSGRVMLQATSEPKWRGATLASIVAAGASTVVMSAGSTNLVIFVGDVFTMGVRGETAISQTNTTISAFASGRISCRELMRSAVAANTSIRCNTGDFSANNASIVFSGAWEDWWPAVYADDSLLWQSPNFWDGKRTAEESQRFPLPYITVFASVVTASYWRIRVDDAANADGVLSFSRLFMSYGWVGDVFLEHGVSLTFESDTTVVRSRAGAQHYDEGETRRVATFTVPHADFDTAMANPFDLAKMQGISRQVYFVLDKDDRINFHRTSWIGTMRRMPQLDLWNVDSVRVGVEIVEDV